MALCIWLILALNLKITVVIMLAVEYGEGMLRHQEVSAVYCVDGFDYGFSVCSQVLSSAMHQPSIDLRVGPDCTDIGCITF